MLASCMIDTLKHSTASPEVSCEHEKRTQPQVVKCNERHSDEDTESKVPVEEDHIVAEHKNPKPICIACEQAALKKMLASCVLDSSKQSTGTPVVSFQHGKRTQPQVVKCHEHDSDEDTESKVPVEEDHIVAEHKNPKPICIACEQAALKKMLASCLLDTSKQSTGTPVVSFQHGQCTKPHVVKCNERDSDEDTESKVPVEEDHIVAEHKNPKPICIACEQAALKKMLAGCILNKSRHPTGFSEDSWEEGKHPQPQNLDCADRHSDEDIDSKVPVKEDQKMAEDSTLKPTCIACEQATIK
ncbi:unnamed protein product, partial [Dicrocoelium dendriticum]